MASPDNGRSLKPSRNPRIFEDKVLVITGGTGTFGNAVLDRFLETPIREIRVFSRDEKKQLIQRLEKGGVFEIRGAVNYMAKVLGLSKYTIYNYLKEVRES